MSNDTQITITFDEYGVRLKLPDGIDYADDDLITHVAELIRHAKAIVECAR